MTTIYNSMLESLSRLNASTSSSHKTELDNLHICLDLLDNGYALDDNKDQVLSEMSESIDPHDRT